MCICVLVFFKVELDKKKEGRKIGKKRDEHFFCKTCFCTWVKDVKISALK